jgi:hypothetical protein
MNNVDIIEMIYRSADIDTKISIQRAYQKYKLTPSKLVLPKIEVHAVIETLMDEPCNHGIFDYTISRMDKKETVITMWWAHYRCIKNVCSSCGGMGYALFSAPKSNPPWEANNFLGRATLSSCEFCTSHYRLHNMI